MRKIILSIVALLTLVSCQRILLYTAGVRNPKEENRESIMKYIVENGLDTNDVYRAKDTTAFVELNKISSSQSGYVFFNSEKVYLKYKDSSSACSAPVILFVENLCTKHPDNTSSKYTLSGIYNRIVPICVSKDTNELFDYYVFIFWYKYLGKNKFKSDVLDIVKSLKEKHCRVKLHLINLDLQPGWSKSIPIRIIG